MHQAGAVKTFGRGAAPNIRGADEFFAVIEQGAAGAADAIGGDVARFRRGVLLVFGGSDFLVVFILGGRFVMRFLAFLGNGFFRLDRFALVRFLRFFRIFVRFGECRFFLAGFVFFRFYRFGFFLGFGSFFRFGFGGFFICGRFGFFRFFGRRFAGLRGFGCRGGGFTGGRSVEALTGEHQRENDDFFHGFQGFVFEVTGGLC